MIADLESEQDSLDQIVADLESSRWLLATESPTWTIADQISHLQFFDERAALALSDPEAFVLDRKRIIAAAPHDLSVDLGRQVSAAELLQAWRNSRRSLIHAASIVDPTVRVPWYGPSMAVSYTHLTLLTKRIV